MFFEFDVHHWLAAYGPWALGVLVGLESMGLPLPGETALIAASLYAATHAGNIGEVIAAATIGAIVGDNIGYMIGREFGFRLLQRFGARIGITDQRIKVGQYLFKKYGAIVVFFGRFVALLRTAAAFLAGVNQLDWRTFLVANACGAVVWASVVGGGAFLFGRQIQRVEGPIGVIGAVVAVAALIAGIVYLRRNEEWLTRQAEAELPGPVRGPKAARPRHRG